jgi:hypothetical protein
MAARPTEATATFTPHGVSQTAHMRSALPPPRTLGADSQPRTPTKRLPQRRALIRPHAARRATNPPSNMFDINPLVPPTCGSRNALPSRSPPKRTPQASKRWDGRTVRVRRPALLGPPALRSASCRVPVRASCVGDLLVLPPVVLYACGGLCLTRRRLLSVVLWWGRSKSTAPPAGLRRARLREARGLSGCGLSVGWWRSGWLSPSPGPGGNQTSAGSATGGRVVWLRRDLVFAGCTPGRSPVGLRLPGEGNNQPRRRSMRCAKPRAHRPLRNRAAEILTDPAAMGKNPRIRTTPPEPHGDIPHRTPDPSPTTKFHTEHPLHP